MNIIILTEEDVQNRVDDAIKKIHNAKKIKASNSEIEKAKAEKAIWKRILYHIKKGEFITLDDENRLEWHINASTV